MALAVSSDVYGQSEAVSTESAMEDRFLRSWPADDRHTPLPFSFALCGEGLTAQPADSDVVRAMNSPRSRHRVPAVSCAHPFWPKFIEDQLRGECGKGVLLKMDSYRRLHAPRGDDYAMGWFVISGGACADGIVLEQDGTNMKTFAVVRMSRELGFAVLASN